ncbi:MAG TPA: NTP transferase domain-containing protein [Firmicutes bacterium]|nr:NTP transferase domain-containing protein [Bacillota bacterium]
MYAVIMAGGEGTRLRPLTCNLPKPLAPLCGRPVLEYILELLSLHGFTRAGLTLLYRGEQIVRHFGEQDYHGVSLSYIFEDTPLGTAGCVKNAAKEEKQDFLVISGDAMCDFNLRDAVRFHRQTGAAATLVVKKVSDPREYGLVSADPSGRINGFLEKPSPAHCTSDLANTGVYILSPSVLELIPDGQKSDFSGDIFPEMLRRGMPLFAYEETGYWCDIGSMKTYLSCQQDMLAGKVKCDLQAEQRNGIYYKGKLPPGHYTITPPAFIGENVRIGTNAHIRGSVLCDHVSVGMGAKVRDSILLDGAYLADYAETSGAVIGKDARLLKGAGVFEGAAIGQSAVIGRDAVIPDGLRVWNGKTVPNGMTLAENLHTGFAEDPCCDEEGICGETNLHISPALCVQIGAAAAGIESGAIGIGCSRGSAGQTLKQALSAGIRSAGGEVWDFGESFASRFLFCLQQSDAALGIYIEAEEQAAVRLFSRAGLPMMRSKERKLEAALSTHEYRKARFDQFGKAYDMSALARLYETALARQAPNGLEGLSTEIRTPDPEIKKSLENALKWAGCSLQEGNITLHAARGGQNVSLYSRETGYVFREQLLALACLDCFRRGMDISLPYSAPHTIDRMAETYGKRVLRYYDCPCDHSDQEARTLAAAQPFLRDGLMMAVRIFSFLHREKLSLSEALALLPSFSTANRTISVAANPAAVLRRLKPEGGQIEEGLRLRNEQGEILIRPAKSGHRMLLFSESRKAETAQELCDFFEEAIQKAARTENPPIQLP